MIPTARRVDWFRAWAAKTRTDEEVNILYAEARATRRGFAFAAEVHKKHSAALPEYASRGATAYALEKADMYQRMSDDSWRQAVKAHEDHRKTMEDIDDDDDDGAREVYLSTQKAFGFEELDHSLARLCLLLVSFCSNDFL